MKSFWFWLRFNASSARNRWMARHLKKRGWVVFYLDPIHRNCRNVCWLHEYEQCEFRDRFNPRCS